MSGDPVPSQAVFTNTTDASRCIRLGGEAGQGLDTMGQLLSRSLIRSGYHIVVDQSYMSRIRGGHNTFSIRTSPDPLTAPKAAVDILVALNQETVDVHHGLLAQGGLVVLDRELDARGAPSLKVPFAELVEKPIQGNVAALGVVAGMLGLEPAVVANLVDETFEHKDPEVTASNRKVLDRAFAWVGQQAERPGPLPPSRGVKGRLMLAGSEAMALGAMAGGVNFCAFYPMTPSTGVALNLIARADDMGIVVEQAEDEIAAINMAIGASFAGARAMVATSGGGFALMTEGVSLAGMTETPVVVVVAQRPGPATGLPTRTEQADLDFVLHAGHGEFPRAVLAPGTPEECFHLMRRSFDLAERFQGPVFVLSDQYLADSYRAVDPFDLDGLPESVRPLTGVDDPDQYERYALTEDGVSPRVIPGLSQTLVVADSDEHTPDGHITEDLGMRKRMVNKRLAKGRVLVAETVPPELHGDPAGALLLVCWGSAKGTVQEVVDTLNAGGRKAAMLHFSQVWPLDPERFLPALQAATQVVGVESNVQGQFVRLIRRETGFHITQRISRYDGLPLTPEQVLVDLSALS